MAKKYFTVEEANRLLPLVQIDLGLLQETKRKFEDKYDQLRQLRTSQPVNEQRDRKQYEDALFTLECELEFLQIEAQSQIESIHMKGVELKDIDQGLLDFPAIVNGEEVLLCWKQGEERVGHYHGLHDGYRARKKIE
jgi:hypothetical protein